MTGKVSPEAAQQLAAAWMSVHAQGGKAEDVANMTGTSLRNVMKRRRNTEKFLGIRLPGLSGTEPLKYVPQYTQDISVQGTVIVASDLHHWPDHEPFSWFMLIEAVKQY